jgi:membrane associated rhomboid family serine protease
MSYNNQYRPGGFGYLPVVTKYIIIINVIMFLLTVLLQSKVSFTDIFGLHYYLAPSFKIYQFITYIFMHGGLMHLFFNMFAVYIFGQVLEQVWGPSRYLAFYLITGLGAAITQYIIMHFQISDDLSILNNAIESSRSAQEQLYNLERKDEYIHNLDYAVIVGASGSLFGLLGAFGMLFPNQLLYIYFLFPIKAKWFVIVYGAIELFSGLRNNPNDNVAHFAHLGGLFVGIILVLLWRKNRSQFY